MEPPDQPKAYENQLDIHAAQGSQDLSLPDAATMKPIQPVEELAALEAEHNTHLVNRLRTYRGLLHEEVDAHVDASQVQREHRERVGNRAGEITRKEFRLRREVWGVWTNEDELGRISDAGSDWPHRVRPARRSECKNTHDERNQEFRFHIRPFHKVADERMHPRASGVHEPAQKK